MRLIGATSKNADRKKRPEAAGFKFGTVGELFNLSEAEELLVEMKVALAEAIRELREVRSLSQADLALLIGSGQARVSKLERSLDSTSLDTLFRCMLALEPVEEWSEEFLACLGAWSGEIPRLPQVPATDLKDPFA